MASSSSNDIWRQMGYVPPRGPCNHKQSLLSGNCPCLRFMLHPLKISSSYSCDGCGHHASFHAMENKIDDETIRKWETEGQYQKEFQVSGSPPRKRRRGDISESKSRATHLTIKLPPDGPKNVALAMTDGNVTGGTHLMPLEIESRSRPMLEWVDENDGGYWKTDDGIPHSIAARSKTTGRLLARSEKKGGTNGCARGRSRK
ncbi:hypothetical protein EV356DRAFT_569278 [Viridothelium virens]|uniref:Uncharacterized protein n=1 Tax=Viridothelium virens TaxID=1048519 RepID=A0A6A6H1D9_VIRVR|nr:hypothetical protein EV356DRAFT_569278 [Viridothelium virens]